MARGVTNARAVPPPQGVGGVLFGVVRIAAFVVVVFTLLALARCATAQAPKNLRAPLAAHAALVKQRGVVRDVPPELASGDLVFIAFKSTIAPGWLPSEVRDLKSAAPMHVAVVIEHPEHGPLLVDASFDTSVDAGVVQPLNSFSRAAPNVLTADGTTVNGSLRGMKLSAALAALKGCVWARRLRKGVTVDADAMWRAVAKLNALVPSMTQGNTNAANWYQSAILGRVVTWGARSIHEDLTPMTDGLIGDGGARHVSCIHTIALLLEAGGAWPYVPHRLDAPMRAAASLRPHRLYRDNMAAVRELYPAEARVCATGRSEPLGTGRVAPIHLMPVDLSSSGTSDAAQLCWDREIYVPTAGCPTDF